MFLVLLKKHNIINTDMCKLNIKPLFYSHSLVRFSQLNLNQIKASTGKLRIIFHQGYIRSKVYIEINI